MGKDCTSHLFAYFHKAFWELMSEAFSLDPGGVKNDEWLGNFLKYLLKICNTWFFFLLSPSHLSYLVFMIDIAAQLKMMHPLSSSRTGVWLFLFHTALICGISNYKLCYMSLWLSVSKSSWMYLGVWSFTTLHWDNLAGANTTVPHVMQSHSG